MRQKKDSTIIKIIKGLFIIIVLAVCMYLITGQIFMPKDSPVDKSVCKPFDVEWNRVLADGTRQPVKIPGKCDAKRKELVTLETVIPDYVENKTYLYIRSSRQEMSLYIDGVLREKYSTEDTRFFGKTSAVADIYLELKEEDAGKTLVMETSSDSSFSGVFYTIYYGDKSSIMNMLFEQYGAELITAFLLLIIGIGSIVGSITLRIMYHKRIDVEYLGWGVFLVAIWLISNSSFRQYLFPSISVVSDIAFYMIMLMAIPFLIYMNGVQNSRYRVLYVIAEIINIIDFFVCTLLHVTRIVDFCDTILIMAAVCIISIGLLVVTITRDIFRGFIKEYLLVAAGMIGAGVMAVIQIIIYFRKNTPFSGVLIAVGLIFLLLVAIIDAVRDIFKMENEKQQAISSNEAKGRFLANMSHEIRTPINAVLGMDEMILRECKEPDILEYATDIRNAGQTLLSLINDILDFSKIESGKLEIIPTEYELASLIHDVTNMMMCKADDKGLKFEISVNEQLPNMLFGDEVRIRQVLLNLLSNAIKYTDEGSVCLRIDGYIADNVLTLEVEVSDTGIGIKEEDLNKLFHEFERIEEKRNRNIEGTGLGMNITASLLKMMNSSLEVSSTYGEGSVFSFKLEQKIVSSVPIGELDKRVKKYSEGNDYETTFTAPEASVLVVDDNAVNRKVFINLLKQTGIKIDEAGSGKECLRKVYANYYDIIFLDHMMPEMDGVETLHKMKGKDEYPCKNTPVIALTANAISGAREMYLSEGFDDFLSKPVIPEKLEKMIKKYLPFELIVSGGQTAKEVDTLQNNAGNSQWETVSDLPGIDGVDWNYGMMHLSDMGLLMELVRDFYKSIESEAEYVERLMTDIENEENLDLYRIKVHAMKSSAALIGIIPLSGMAKILEFAARDKKYDIIYSMTPIFLEEWRSYSDKLKVCVEDEDEALMEVSDYSVITTFLDMINIALAGMDIDMADEAVKQLKLYRFPSEIQSGMEELESAVINLDGSRAEIVIKNIKEQIDGGVAQ